MAPFFSNAKVLSSFVANTISKRGLSAAAAPQIAKGGAAPRSGGLVKKTTEEIVRSEKVAWVPDPRTGFYRPENVADEIDVAELRATLLKKN